MLPCSGLVVVLCRKQTWPHQPPRGKLYGGGPGVPGGGWGGGVVTRCCVGHSLFHLVGATPTPYLLYTDKEWHSSWVRGMSACGYSVPLRTNCGPEDPGRRSSGVERKRRLAGWRCDRGDDRWRSRCCSRAIRGCTTAFTLKTSNNLLVTTHTSCCSTAVRRKC